MEDTLQKNKQGLEPGQAAKAAILAECDKLATAGVTFVAVQFGVTIVNSDAKQIPVRYVGEQHVREDLGRIPTAQDWLLQIKPQRWMYGQRANN